MAATNTRPDGRRTVLAVVALIVAALLTAAASIGISVQLDRQARDKGECLIDARNTEFSGLRTEMTATTRLLQWAIRNQGQDNQAELADAIAHYQTDVADARQSYRDARHAAAAC